MKPGIWSLESNSVSQKLKTFCNIFQFEGNVLFYDGDVITMFYYRQFPRGNLRRGASVRFFAPANPLTQRQRTGAMLRSLRGILFITIRRA